MKRHVHLPKTYRTDLFGATGYCRKCQTVHGLPIEGAITGSHALMRTMQQTGTIASIKGQRRDTRLSIDYLFGEARGKMFGVLCCRDKHNRPVNLKAFSGQYNGIWEIEGWAPPLFATDQFFLLNNPEESKIKSLGHQLTRHEKNSQAWRDLRAERRRRSQKLTKKIHDLYTLTNTLGERKSLHEAFLGNGGIPTGTGDCCGPKLLAWAHHLNLTPLAMAEFYFGRENRSGTRRHATFYPSCREKCQPILGFMLCQTQQCSPCEER